MSNSTTDVFTHYKNIMFDQNYLMDVLDQIHLTVELKMKSNMKHNDQMTNQN
jgi:hypothetical protein